MIAAERAGAAAYRLLLLLLPGAFRRVYGQEMHEMFEQRQRAARARASRPGGGLLGVWRREFVALLATAVRARFGADAGVGPPSGSTFNRRSPAQGTIAMDTFLFDLKTALHAIRSNRGFAAVAVLAMALGIGANAAMFSVVYGVLQQLPYPEGERIGLVYEDQRGDRSSRMSLSPAEYAAVDADDSVFDEVGAYQYSSALLEGEPYPESVGEVRLSHDFMDLLGVRVRHGREFSESDSVDPAVVVIGYELWQRRWSGDPNLVGRAITISGRSYEVIGITEPDFTYFNDSNRLFTLLTFTAEQLAGNRSHNVLVLGRRRADVSVTEADARVAAVADAAQRLDDHVADEQRTVFIYPLYDAWVGSVREPLRLLMGAVVVLALIACANVANLEIARGLARRREIAVRMALGARPSGVVRELVVESVLLALLGGVAGLLLASASMSWLHSLIATNLPRADNIELDLGVFGFVLALSLATGVLAGIAPAWVVSRQQLAESIQEGGSTVAGSRSAAWLRKAFLVAQVSMALVLTVGAGLLLRSVGHLRAVDMGFDAREVVVGSLSIGRPEYGEPGARLRLLADIDEGLSRNPAIESVGVTNLPPGIGFMISEDFVVEGAGPTEPVSAIMRAANPGLFDSLHIEALHGRVLTTADNLPGAAPVVVVNDSFARMFGGAEEVVGKRLRTASDGDDSWMTVIGVVPALKSSPFQADTMPAVYLPTAWRPNQTLFVPWLVVRTGASPEAVEQWTRALLGELDDRLPAPTFRPLDAAVAGTFARQRLNSILLAMFAGIALLLAAVGEYAVIQYVVRQRTAEIGIRLALGARAGEVVAMVLRQGLTLAALGVAAGLAVAWAGSRIIESMLFGIDPTDPLTYGITAAFLATVAALASLVPAWRAGRVDPIIALRSK